MITSSVNNATLLEGGFGYSKETKTLTFDGATTNAVGNVAGTGNPATLFTVTGHVIARIFAIVTTAIVSTGNTGTIEVGIAGDTATLIAQSTVGSGTFIAEEIWHDGTPDAEIELLTVAADRIVSDGNDVILTCATNNIISGVLAIYCIWTALSSDGNVVAA